MQITKFILAAALLTADSSAQASTTPPPHLFSLAAYNDSTKCASVPVGAGAGTNVVLEPCGASGWNDLWYVSGSQIVLSGTSLCLDIGPSVFNGVVAFVSACAATPPPGQEWTHTPVDGSASPPLIWSSTGFAGGWCLEAQSTNSGDAVRAYHGTGLPNQWWIGSP